MLGNLANLAVWLLVAAFLVVLGWDEPLKYRFMSREGRDAEERALVPTPKPTPPPPDYRTWSSPKKGGTLGNSSLNAHGQAPTPRRH